MNLIWWAFSKIITFWSNNFLDWLHYEWMCVLYRKVYTHKFGARCVDAANVCVHLKSICGVYAQRRKSRAIENTQKKTFKMAAQYSIGLVSWISFGCVPLVAAWLIAVLWCTSDVCFSRQFDGIASIHVSAGLYLFFCTIARVTNFAMRCYDVMDQPFRILFLQFIRLKLHLWREFQSYETMIRMPFVSEMVDSISRDKNNNHLMSKLYSFVYYPVRQNAIITFLTIIPIFISFQIVESLRNFHSNWIHLTNYSIVCRASLKTYVRRVRWRLH